MSNNIKNVLLVGTGMMAIEYVKVLKGMGENYQVVGNSKKSVDNFMDITGVNAHSGGIEQYVKAEEWKKQVPQSAIVAVNGNKLYEVTKLLIEAGVKKILVEKPGGILLEEIQELISTVDKNGTRVFVAYNRRFYSSVKKAKEIIQEDGGITSLNFEFTEWKHVVEKTSHPDEIKQKWFLMNSSHVVDLAFYLGGQPEEITVYKAGGLTWHKAGSVFTGCGITQKGILFNYQANWDAPGRWGIEILTQKHRLYLKPLEKLQIQKIGSVAVEEYNIDDSLDCEYKAGLFQEVNAFLNEDIETAELCTLQEQAENLRIYQKISGEKY